MAWLRKVTRRDLLVAASGAAVAGASGLLLGFAAGTRRERWNKNVPPRPQPFSPNVFLAIDEAGLVTIWLTRTEMGQGVMTALPMLVAEELEADFRRVRVELAFAGRQFGNQVTATSSSVRDSWDELRRAGAAAREMLVTAAARVWDVPGETCRARGGHVIHEPSGRILRYGQLVTVAAELPVPKNPTLKTPEQFRLIGQRVPRVDTPSKVDGSAVFGIDVRLPGMVFAAVLRRPALGGSIQSFDEAEARKVPGVIAVRRIASGVAVIASNTWAAFRGRSALAARVQHEDGASSASFDARFRQLAQQTGTAVRERGKVGVPPPSGGKQLEAEYRVPYLAHAGMEPPSCTARVAAGRCEVWASTQDPLGAREHAARVSQLPEAEVAVYPQLVGGGFGRRVAHDEVGDAVELSQALNQPVQVVFSREDDLHHDYFRPGAWHQLRAVLGPEAQPVGWEHRVVVPSLVGTPADQPDMLAVDGSSELPYAFENLRVAWVKAEFPVPVGFWRSVGHSHNAFANECFIDELAEAAGQDPLTFRRKLLTDAPRHRAVLDLAAERAGWGTPPPEGRARGLALHASFGSYVAMVAEVSADAGAVRVHRVVCAADVGTVVNPDIVEAQLEGGVVFGLSAALFGEITFERGAVVQSNFHDYRLLRLDEMPLVEVHLVKSQAPVGGVGEIGVPPIAPAVANALYGITRRRVRALPIKLA